MGHNTKVNPQNRSFAAPLLTLVIIDCIDVDRGVIQRLDDAGKGFQSCCGYNFLIFTGEGQNLTRKKQENLTTDRYEFDQNQSLLVE